MSDDAYITPSEREPESHALGERFAQWGDQWDLLNTIAMSHAVVDSVAADLAAALREACEGEEICDCWRCRERKPYGPCGWGVRVREQVDAALARYDALHKEAGNE